MLSGRISALDSAKGIGIVLVVFGHAWRGSFRSGIDIDAGVFGIVDRAVYAFHMPLFFFLSALLFVDFVRRFDVVGLLKNRVVRLLWPMALWSWIFFAIKLTVGARANSPVTPGDFPVVPLPPYEHLWFLWALFLIQVGVGVFYLALRDVWRGHTFRIAMGVAAVVLVLAMPLIEVPSIYVGAAVRHLPYFLAGIALGSLAGWRASTPVALACGVLTLALIGWSGLMGAVPVVSLVIIVALCVLVGWFDDGREAPGPATASLRVLGMASLSIYLMHTIFSAGLRMGLLAVGVDDPVLQITAQVAIGLIGPLVVLQLLSSRPARQALGV